MKKPTASVRASHLNTGTGIPDEELAWPETSGRVTRLPRLHVEIATFHGHALRGSGAGDGEEDSTDACPDTPPGEAVDQAGCSLVQFCASVDPGAKVQGHRLHERPVAGIRAVPRGPEDPAGHQ